HKLRFHAQCFERVPEFVGLRRRTLAITVTYKHQRRSFRLLDVGDWRALGINLRIVIDRSAKERDHPLIDLVLSVIAREVCQPAPADAAGKAIGLRDGPHGQVPAVAPTGNAETMLVDRRSFQRLVNAGHDVTKIAIAKILDVGASESLALSVTATGIR